MNKYPTVYYSFIVTLLFSRSCFFPYDGVLSTSTQRNLIRQVLGMFVKIILGRSAFGDDYNVRRVWDLAYQLLKIILFVAVTCHGMTQVR